MMTDDTKKLTMLDKAQFEEFRQTTIDNRNEPEKKTLQR